MSNDHLTQDVDPIETQEWLDSLESMITREGPERAHYLLEQLVDKARRSGAYFPYKATTAYVNTIPTANEAELPGSLDMEKRISSLIRWNAMAMVVRANRKSPELGGHIATFASSAVLYEVAFNHFFRAPTEEKGGDIIFWQGHSAPGIYARAFLEGRLTEEQLEHFRQEITHPQGLSSYPHAWLMPDFWEFPTVSMGLGPIQAIYQARFMKYLENRGLVDTKGRKVWCFCGDGEMDEPESLGAISLAGREGLDNLVFVINCNLQRLDGPVRGNGKIIQELEGVFRGAGWNAIKVLWGKHWDPLFAKDTKGLLVKRMEEACDGDYQNYKGHGGAYTREHFFGKYPELKEMVAHMTDEDIWKLNRGGHDPQKVYAAYHAANEHKGQPTVIIAKTVKGYGMGEEGQGQNATHQLKKLDIKTIRHFRDTFKIDISDDELDKLPFFKLPEDSEEFKYMKEKREALGGSVPTRRTDTQQLPIPDENLFDSLLKGSGERENSTTMTFVRFLAALKKDKNYSERIVPIIPDEGRTFGMEGMFRQWGIYSSVGQKYKPIDAGQMMFYHEDQKGQILEEGITEAGSFCSWIAAATSYSAHNYPMVPFYIFYSMFGFQRIGDLAWAAGDAQARGFLLGATAGRTTLAGEGLQHQDGHSHILAGTIPNCITYDPAYGYELIHILQEGMKRMYHDQENVFYYITVMNENYIQPECPEGVKEGILRGMYQLESKGESEKNRVQLLGSGTILREVIKAAEILKKDYQVGSDIWSVTSFNELRKEGLEVSRWNRLHPESEDKVAYVTECLEGRDGPVIATTDYMKLYADQIREFVPGDYHVLGTDGYGRSDTRKSLRHFFEVDAKSVVVATLNALAEQGKVDNAVVTKAMKDLGVDPEKPNPSQV